MPARNTISIDTNVVPRFMRGIQQSIQQTTTLDTADKPRYDVCVDTNGVSSWHDTCDNRIFTAACFNP
jgi:hypothetical protein